jgi:hypothetical protein
MLVRCARAGTALALTARAAPCRTWHRQGAAPVSRAGTARSPHGAIPTSHRGICLEAAPGVPVPALEGRVMRATQATRMVPAQAQAREAGGVPGSGAGGALGCVYCPRKGLQITFLALHLPQSLQRGKPGRKSGTAPVPGLRARCVAQLSVCGALVRVEDSIARGGRHFEVSQDLAAALASGRRGCLRPFPSHRCRNGPDPPGCPHATYGGATKLARAFSPNAGARALVRG